MVFAVVGLIAGFYLFFGTVIAGFFLLLTIGFPCLFWEFVVFVPWRYNRAEPTVRWKGQVVSVQETTFSQRFAQSKLKKSRCYTVTVEYSPNIDMTCDHSNEERSSYRISVRTGKVITPGQSIWLRVHFAEHRANVQLDGSDEWFENLKREAEEMEADHGKLLLAACFCAAMAFSFSAMYNYVGHYFTNSADEGEENMPLSVFIGGWIGTFLGNFAISYLLLLFYNRIVWYRVIKFPKAKRVARVDDQEIGVEQPIGMPLGQSVPVSGLGVIQDQDETDSPGVEAGSEVGSHVHHDNETRSEEIIQGSSTTAGAMSGSARTNRSDCAADKVGDAELDIVVSQT